jgi:hypothetical protein
MKLMEKAPTLESVAALADEGRERTQVAASNMAETVFI